MESQLATRADTNRIELRLERIEGEIRLNRWMLALIVAAEVVPILAKLFS